MPEQNVSEFFVARAVIVNSLGELLITRRSDTCSYEANRGLWEFPGGKLDPAELTARDGHAQAAYRETLEETGVKAVFDTIPQPPLYRGVHEFTTERGIRRRRITQFLFGIAVSEQITLQDSELSYAEWRPSPLIPKLKLTPDSRAVLKIHDAITGAGRLIPSQRSYIRPAGA